MAIVEASAKLIAHAGAVPISRENLASLYTPPRTNTHYPVPHSDLITFIETRLWETYKVGINKTNFAVMNEGMRLFGTLTLSTEFGDFALALGIRTSNDRTLKLQFICGANVFVCDNMAFSGESLALDRKHTGRLNPRMEVYDAIDRAMGKYNVLNQRIAELKQIKITETEAKAMLFDMMALKYVNLNAPLRIFELFANPTHQEQAKEFGGTMWMLNNAVTEYAKGLPANQALEVSQNVGKMLLM